MGPVLTRLGPWALCHRGWGWRHGSLGSVSLTFIRAFILSMLGLVPVVTLNAAWGYSQQSFA
jgi:hypothetical protein